MKKFLLLAAALTLTACGSKTKGADIEQSALGTPTKQQAETTPDNLAGDKANARYSGEQLQGKGMVKSDGDGDG